MCTHQEVLFLQNWCRVLWPNYVKCLAKCRAHKRCLLQVFLSCSPICSHKQEIDKPAKRFIKAVWCNFNDLHQSFCHQFRFGPWGGISFELKFPVQGRYILTSLTSLRHSSVKFTVNRPHSPAKTVTPAMGFTLIFLGQHFWGDNESNPWGKCTTLVHSDNFFSIRPRITDNFPWSGVKKIPTAVESQHSNWYFLEKKKELVFEIEFSVYTIQK